MMYWLSYVVIALILGGLIAAWKTEIYLTQMLVIINLLIFMFVFIPGVRYPEVTWRVYDELAGRAIYMQTGESLHTFLTLMFLHASFMHIAGNILVLFFIGIALEDRIGKKKTAVAYFLTGIFATTGQYMVNWGSTNLNLGASGAVMGLMGVIVYLYPRDKIPMFLGPIFMPQVRVDLAVGVFVAMQTGIALLNPYSNIAHAAHIAGFGSGIIIAYFLGKARTTIQKKKQRDYTKLERLVTGPGLAEIYRKIIEADNDDVRDAWLEVFYKKAKCPRCKGNMGKERCKCGYDPWG